MSGIFKAIDKKQTNTIMTCQDLPSKLLQLWAEEYFRFTHDQNYFTKVTDEDVRLRMSSQSTLIHRVQEILHSTKHLLNDNAMFIYTDIDGIILYLFSSDKILSRVASAGIEVGTCMDMQHAGVNSISLAMKIKERFIIQGDEHQHPLFKNWTCICYPIRDLADQMMGYLDVSFSSTEESDIMLFILDQLSFSLSRSMKLSIEDSEDSNLQLNHILAELGLTHREIEVAVHWLSNKSVLCMAELLDISEGTIRNHLKKVYRKTGVNDRGQFMHKFLKFIE